MSPRPVRTSPPPDHPLLFLQGFLKRPKEVASIIPSSRFLMRRVVRFADVARARLVLIAPANSSVALKIAPGFPLHGRLAGGRLAILQRVNEVLAPGGRFVAYQARDRVEVLGRQVFGKPRVQLELLNVPPMRVYRWDRPLAARS